MHLLYIIVLFNYIYLKIFGFTSLNRKRTREFLCYQKVKDGMNSELRENCSTATIIPAWYFNLQTDGGHHPDTGRETESRGPILSSRVDGLTKDTTCLYVLYLKHLSHHS